MSTELDAQIPTSLPKNHFLCEPPLVYISYSCKVSGCHVVAIPSASLDTVDEFSVISEPIRPFSSFLPVKLGISTKNNSPDLCVFLRKKVQTQNQR